MTIRAAQTQAAKIASEHGFKETDLSTKLLLMVGEVAEGFEEIRAGRAVDEVYEKEGKPEGLPIELADVIIRILSFADAHNIDMEEMVSMKMTYRSEEHTSELQS